MKYYNAKCIEYKSNTKKLWGVINDVKGKLSDKTCIVDCIKVDNIDVYNPIKIANTFGQHYANVGKNYADAIPKSRNSVLDYINKIPRVSNSCYLQSCTRTEIENLINSLPNKTSSGFEKISNILLKELSSCVSYPLMIIFNTSLSTGHFPDQMKHAYVIPLYKGGNKRFVANYRPISLLITISKLLEKIMYKCIYDFLDVNHALYDSQYGFRKKHSCEHAISELLSNIVKGFEKREFTISIFLDLSKAFDTLLHSVLFVKLEHYGIRGIVLEWFKSYLCDRSMQAKCNTGGPERF